MPHRPGDPEASLAHFKWNWLSFALTTSAAFSVSLRSSTPPRREATGAVASACGELLKQAQFSPADPGPRQAGLVVYCRCQGSDPMEVPAGTVPPVRA